MTGLIWTQPRPAPVAAPAVIHDRIEFEGACPSCGHPCPWIQVREDTRLNSHIRCDCGGVA